MKFDRQLRPATETLWVVSYGVKIIPKWRTAAILNRHYLSEKSSDFHEILYTAADFELDERHVIKNEKLHRTNSEFDITYFLFCFRPSLNQHPGNVTSIDRLPSCDIVAAVITGRNMN